MFKYLSALAKEDPIICISKVDWDSVKSLYLTYIYLVASFEFLSA